MPQERPWGFTQEAEILNGRVAMGSIVLASALSLDPTLKALVAVYRASREVVQSVADSLPDAVTDAVGEVVSAVSDAVSPDGLGM